MSMVTRCPSCATTFRVMPQQLQAQQGMVRCGRCATVFDGFKTLATLPDVAPVDTASETAGARSQPAVAEIPLQSRPQTQTQPPTRPSAPAPASADVLKPVEEAIAPLELSAAPQEIAAPEPQPVLSAEPFVAETLPHKRSRGFGFGVILLLLALMAQGAYFYRSEIAAHVPEARPYLNKMCEQLRCTVALPQRPRSISIEASDMQAMDPANPGLIALTATLRNHATTALGYPALDVVLTNTREHTVARRVFMPPEYLDAGNDARAGIPPNAEITVRLNIDSGDLGAAGFRLDLLAAPPR